MNYKISLTGILLIIVSNLAIAQNKTETRNLIKTVPVSKQTTLEVSNKYGTIRVTPWSKDSASIRAEIKAYGKDESKFPKMFEGIKINIADSKYVVKAQTEFTSGINMLFENFKGMTSKMISYDSHVEINYYINVPEYMNLKVENKYGDVYIEKSTGEFSISISNGSFKANSIGKNSSLSMVFCDAKINSVESGTLDASFSDINIGTAEDLTINSISSKYDIKKAGVIKGDSRRDKFYIDRIESLNGTAYFTEYRVNALVKAINLNSKYGSIDAEMIEKGFESVDINSGYSDISLNFDPATSYNLDIRHTNTFLVLPDQNLKSEKKALNEDRKEYFTSGTFGKNPGNIKVKIEANRGNIYIK